MAGMSAMEQMVAKMLGISPEEMHRMLTGFSTLASELKAQLDRVEAGLQTIITNQDAMLARLEVIENGNGNSRRRGKPGNGNDERASAGGRSDDGSGTGAE